MVQVVINPEIQSARTTAPHAFGSAALAGMAPARAAGSAGRAVRAPKGRPRSTRRGRFQHQQGLNQERLEILDGFRGLFGLMVSKSQVELDPSHARFLIDIVYCIS